MTVSILICTHNRAAQLDATMDALGRLDVPAGMTCELIVVDNASTDQTPHIIQSRRLPNMDVRYLCEKRPGKCYGLNTAIAASQGRILLFTDDDAHPPQDWIAQMCAPILAGEADAVSGGVHTAPHLVQPWMTPEQRAWLVSSEFTQQEEVTAPFLIGANMAISKDVLLKVPGYDPELGPGPVSMGAGEDSLFSEQVRVAGYQIVSILRIAVEHHFDESRVSRAGFIERRRREGRAAAYMAHHWQHFTITLPGLRLAKHALQLSILRALRRREWASSEGCPVWEMELIQDISFYQQYLIERQRPRNYTRHGLVKRAETLPSAPSPAGRPVTAEGQSAS